ncbi:MAG: hypothetical protein GX667_05980 [Xanthomonadaceae bacterium]|nr:hypothetical protein [Xanthomonadaceae bacterium]
MRQNYRVTGREKGSLLLEFLVAVGIATFALAGLAVMQNKTMRELRGHKDMMSSGFILSDVIDRMSVTGFDKVGEFKNPSSEFIKTELADIKENAELFNRKVKIEGIDNCGAGGRGFTIEVSEVAQFDENEPDTVTQSVCFYPEAKSE